MSPSGYDAAGHLRPQYDNLTPRQTGLSHHRDPQEQTQPPQLGIIGYGPPNRLVNDDSKENVAVTSRTSGRTAHPPQSPLEKLESSHDNVPFSSAPSSRQNQNQQPQQQGPAALAAQLRVFFIHYQPSMCTQIDTLVRANHAHPDKLWKALFKKYGPMPTAESTKASKSSIRAELILYFRHYEPALEGKIDDILNAFADFDDVMWQSLEARFGPRSAVAALRGGPRGSSSGHGFGEDDGAGAGAGGGREGAGINPDDLGLPMDLSSRLRRFFEAHDPGKLPRVDEMSSAYRYKELELAESLRLLYGHQMEPPVGGYSETQEDGASERSKTAKQLRLSRGALLSQDLERFLTAWATRYAPERLAEVEVIATRFRGKETQLREHIESVFGPVAMQNVPKTLDLAAERESARRQRESLQRAEPPEVRIKRAALQQRLARFFEAHDRKMLKKVTDMADKFNTGNLEEKLFRKLVKVYGPEPATNTALQHYKDRLVRFYKKYQPQLVETVPELLRRHAGHEDDLMYELVRKWGPEPPTSDEVLKRLRAYSLAKLQCYFKFHDPLMLTCVDSIFKRYTAVGKELELVAALEQIYGPLPAWADFTVTDAANYGPPQEQRGALEIVATVSSPHLVVPAASSSSSSAAAAAADSNIDFNLLFGESGDHDKENSSSNECGIPGSRVVGEAQRAPHKIITWTPGCVPPTDPVMVKQYQESCALALTMEPVDPSKIRPTEAQRHRLLNYLGYYAPKRVNEVDKIFAVFGGRMDDIMDMLRQRFGAEPSMDNQFSKAALEESAKQLRQLFSRYYAHYDPSLMYAVETQVQAFIGCGDAARQHLMETYGPEPTYLPLGADLRRRLIFFFRYYDPPQLMNVDVLADAYIGMEDQLFAMLTEQYGPEPKINFKAGRPVFRERLRRYMRAHPDSHSGILRNCAAACPDLEPSAVGIEAVLARFEDFQDEFMADLVAEFGTEPPDPQEEARLLKIRREREAAEFALTNRLNEFFEVYDPPQLEENVATLVSSYWNDPETLMKQLYETYSVDHEVITHEPQPPGAKDVDDEANAPPPPKPDFLDDDGLWERITRMYLKYQRSSVSSLPLLVEKYKGRYLELLEGMVEKYGPEPDPSEDLSMPKEDTAGMPSMTVQPTVPLSKHQQPERQVPAAVRAERILQRYDPRKMRDLPRLLKRYEHMEDDLVSVLEERYELHPGTLIPISQKLRPEDLLDRSGLEQGAALEREREEQQREKSVLLSTRDRCLRMYQLYDVPAMVTLDLDLQKCNGDPAREQEYLDGLVNKYGPEPVGDISILHRIRRYYTYIAPDQLSKMPDALQRFHGRELVIMKMLLTKYKQPEPQDPEIIPSITPEVMEYRAAVRTCVEGIYRRHDPAKLGNVPALMQKYQGSEESLLAQLDAKFQLQPEDITIAANLEQMQRMRRLVTRIYELAAPQKMATLDTLLKRYRLDLRNLEEQVAEKYPAAFLQARRGLAAAGAEAAPVRTADLMVLDNGGGGGNASVDGTASLGESSLTPAPAAVPSGAEQ